MSHTSLDTTFLGMLPQNEGLPFLTQSRIVVESKLFEKELGGAFLGCHTGLDVPVVIRVMQMDVRNSFTDFERFRLATRQLARVRHPNSAAIFDLGEFNGHPYMVLEYVCGVPLIERIKNRPLQAGHAMQMLLPIASALCEFWNHDLVHRAVSPDFIYLQCEGPAKLDITALCCSQCDGRVKEIIGQKLIPYWSPEEIRGQDVGPQSDMWSFGATLYQSITGHAPFGGQSVKEIQAAILLEEPADPRKYVPDLPIPLCELLLKLLSRDPLNRFASGEAFMTALRSVDEHCSRPPMAQETELVPPPSPNAPKSPVKASSTQSAPAVARDARIGDVIGQCRLIRRAGSGAFGVVYHGRHTVLDIDVAVKVLPPDTVQREPGFIDMPAPPRASAIPTSSAFTPRASKTASIT
jgi:eukaryotic-like serine/threonine-protein kinase